MVSATPGWRADRSGHSLPELLVALTFLAATLAAMASVTLLATGWTADAVLRQRALATAEAALDSLVVLPVTPAGGDRSETDPPWTVAWHVDPTVAGGGATAASGPPAATLRVTVTGPRGPAPVVELRGLWIALPPAPLP